MAYQSFAEGFASGIERGLKVRAQDESDAAKLAASRYEENKTNFFEQEKADQEKIKQAEALVNQLYPGLDTKNKEARKSDIVQLLRSDGVTFKDAKELMEERIYEEIKEEEKKEKEVVKAEETPVEKSKTGDIVSQTEMLLSEEDADKTGGIVEKDGEELPGGGDGIIDKDADAKVDSRDPNFLQQIFTEEGREFAKEKRINKRVDKLTGTTQEVRETVSGTWQPTKYTDPSGTTFSLKVGKDDKPTVWDLYYDSVVKSDSYQQADEDTRVQMLMLAEQDYINAKNNKGYTKSTYINEVNRFEAMIDENNANPGTHSKEAIDNANFMLSVILPKRKSRLDLFDEDDGKGTKADKDLPEYNVFIKADNGNIEQRVGKHTTMFATDQMISEHNLTGVEKGDEIDVYKFAGNRVIPFTSSFIDNAETTGRQEQRQKIGNQINNDKLFLDIVEKRTASSSMAKQALMLDGLVEQDEEILRLGGGVNRFFNELYTDVNSVLDLFKGQELSEAQADDLVNSYFNNLPQTEKERAAKNHRLYTMRLIKFAYASSRADGNYGQGLSDTDLRLKLESIQGAKDYSTFSKSLKALVNDSFAEIDEMLGGFVKQGNVIEYQQLGGKLAVNTMQQEAEEFGWNDAYSWSQSSVEEWQNRNNAEVVEDTTNGNVENVPEQKTILKTQVISDALIKIKPELADQKGRTIIIYSDGTTEIEGISE